MENFEGGVNNYDEFLKKPSHEMQKLSSENLANIYRTLKETTQMQTSFRRTK